MGDYRHPPRDKLATAYYEQSMAGMPSVPKDTSSIPRNAQQAEGPGLPHELEEIDDTSRAARCWAQEPATEFSTARPLVAGGRAMPA